MLSVHDRLHIVADHAGTAAACRHGARARVRQIQTVEHPFVTIKARMGATHFLMGRLPNVACEMALRVLAYNLTRVMNIVGRKTLIEAIRAA